jgi:hypothetical protein
VQRLEREDQPLAMVAARDGKLAGEVDRARESSTEALEPSTRSGAAAVERRAVRTFESPSTDMIAMELSAFAERADGTALPEAGQVD